MHIVQLSDMELVGGAAISTARLAHGLVGTGHHVTRLVAMPDREGGGWETETLTSPPPRASLSERVARRVFPGPRWQESAGRQIEKALDDKLTDRLDALKPDIINIHNLHSASAHGWSLGLVRTCARFAPIVWTLHDMWSFTGRCAYSYDCRRFVTGCNPECPTWNEYPALAPDRIAPAWEDRRGFLAEHPGVVAVAPSRWLGREAKAGLWKNHRVEVIPYGLPLDVFRPIRPAVAREALGIQTPGTILMVAAQLLSERRKGGQYLVEAMPEIARRPLTILTLGAGRMDVGQEGVYFHSLGYVENDRMKALAYSAADLFVHPAPVDNLPNVVLESIACGTPVVGFPIGGVPDMVRPGKTGWLARELSSDALAVAINAALADLSEGMALRECCRSIAEAEYPLDLQARRYEDLFHTMRK